MAWMKDYAANQTPRKMATPKDILVVTKSDRILNRIYYIVCKILGNRYGAI